MKKLAVGAIRLYQKWISPVLRPRCRFTPSCSEYAIQAISKRGVLKGGAAAAYRVARCAPWSKGGYDPVR